MTEPEARQAVVEAGRRLLVTGLIARTWGNLSARIGADRFVITPSGLPYETLTAAQLPVVTGDGRWEGPCKPSSEKGIHAAVYRLRPEICFVIHTHQKLASAVSVSGNDLTDLGDPLLGETVPCAAYGLPSTKKLRRAVLSALARAPGSRAVLMKNHGALCLGKDPEEAFAVAEALEKHCAALLPAQAGEAAETDLGSSRREDGRLLLTRGGAVSAYRLEDPALPAEAALHAAVGRAAGARFVLQERDWSVTELSRRGRTIRPYLDDLAQIAGTTIRCAGPETAASAIRGRGAVLLRGQGALCVGKTEADAEAVAMILRKDCLAQLYAEQCGNARPLAAPDAALQRFIYQTKYEKRGEGGGCGKS